MKKIIKKIINTVKGNESGSGIVVHLMEEEDLEGIKRSKTLRISRFDDYHFKEEIFIVVDDL